MSILLKITRCCAAVTILSVTSSGWAQYGGGYGGQMQRPRGPQTQQPQQQPRKMKMEGEGTLIDVAQGAIKLLVNGEAWIIHIERGANVRVTGATDVSALRPGEFVRFQGDFDDQGTLTTPLAAIEIITPHSPAAVGIFPVAAAAAPSGKTAGRSAKRGQTGAGTYLVVGKLTAIKERELTIAATNKPLIVGLGDTPTVQLDVANYSLAKPGDKVAVQGWYTQRGVGYANQVSIALGGPAAAAGGAAAPKGAQPGPVLQPAGGAK